MPNVDPPRPSQLGEIVWLEPYPDELLSGHALVPIYFYTSKHLVRPEVQGFEANPLDHHASRFLRLEPRP